MKLVMLDRSTIDSSVDFSMVSSQVKVIEVFQNTCKYQIVERCKDANIILTNKVHLDELAISRLPNLKLICILATGTNNVDLKAARNAGVAVTNVAGYSTHSVGQYIFSFLLNIVHQVGFYIHNNQVKPWHKSKTFCQVDAPITELAEKSLGILGYGNLGKAVAQLGEAFGMKVIISERPGVKQVREGRVAFDEMITISDVISLHCPLSSENEALFDKTVFRQMKKECIFINTARGAIVNSTDLAEALKSKEISHAIVDVLEVEPPDSFHPLLQAEIPNLTLTHHIAWGSQQAQQRLINGVSKNIAAFLQGKALNRVEI